MSVVPDSTLANPHEDDEFYPSRGALRSLSDGGSPGIRRRGGCGLDVQFRSEFGGDAIRFPDVRDEVAAVVAGDLLPDPADVVDSGDFVFRGGGFRHRRSPR